ncbi:MAG: hypothetical protein ACLRFR_01330 [Clostridia bacterium]
MDMNKDERLKSFFNNIADVFFRGNWCQDEYEYLIQVIPAYLKIKLDIEEIPVVFKDLPETTIGQYKPFKKEIEISQNCYSYKTDDMPQNIEQIFNLVVTISHELYHALDFRMQKGTRNFEDKCSALKHLSEHKPQNKEIYDALQGAIYYNSRVETFARQGSLKVAQGFIEDLKAYAKAHVKATEKEQQEYQLVKDYAAAKGKGEDVQFPQISPEGLAFVQTNVKMGIFENLWEGENFAEDLNKNLHTANEMAYSQMANKDLEELSEKILNKEIEASEDMIFDLAYSLMHKNFYNETTINNLLQFAQNTEDEYIINTVEFNIQLAKQTHFPQKDNEQAKDNNSLL